MQSATARKGSSDKQNYLLVTDVQMIKMPILQNMLPEAFFEKTCSI